jgi:hypothetical protein
MTKTVCGNGWEFSQEVTVDRPISQACFMGYVGCKNQVFSKVHGPVINQVRQMLRRIHQLNPGKRPFLGKDTCVLRVERVD